MRYTVGTKYPFLLAVFEKKAAFREEFIMTRLFVPWVHDLKELRVVNMLCSEHHKVASEHDQKGEKVYDGYIFTDEATGDVYYNQYPKASYGQLDDSGDRAVYRHWPEEEQQRIIAEEEQKPIMERYVGDRDPFRRWEDAAHYLVTIKRGIWHFSEKKEKPSADLTISDIDAKIVMLTDWLDQTTKAVEDATGKQVTFKDHVIHFTNGKPDETLPGWWDVELVDKQPEAA